jgi:xylose dehydrogenase (NAD/NADP)
MSTANINDRILAAARNSDRIEITAVGSRNLAKATAYARKHGLPTAHGTYDDLLADPTIEAVYISLPNHMHIEWTIRALKAGKHVLCEKPLCRDPSRASEAFDVADASQRVLSEAFMWRHHPQTRKATELIESGAIGSVTGISCFLGFDLAREWNLSRADGAPNPDAWHRDVRMSPAYEGGALMDVGTYCVNAIRLFGGEPKRVMATQEFSTTGVDLRTKGLIECDSGARAQFECSFVDPRTERLEISGEHGRLVVHTPFMCREPRLDIVADGRRQSIPVATPDPYRLELENLSDSIRGKTAPLLGRQDAIPQALALAALQQSANRQSWIDVGSQKPASEDSK